MLMLISPGIYVPPVPQFPKVFHNMGIRIEVRNHISLTGDMFRAYISTG